MMNTKKIYFCFIYIGSLYSAFPFQNAPTSSTTTNNSNGYSTSQPSFGAATPNNYGFQLADWQNLLLPLMEEYTTSGLTTYYYNGAPAIPDFALAPFMHAVQAQKAVSLKAQPSYGGQFDSFPTLKTTSGILLDPKAFLTSQSISKTNSGWYSTFGQSCENAMTTFLSRGLGTTSTQYALAFIENLIGRIAVGVSVFNTPAAQTNGGVLGYTNPQVGPLIVETTNSVEPTIISNFFNTAQLLYAQARYARAMHAFPAGLSAQLNTTNSFSLPTNINDANFGNTTEPGLNPMNTFCGVIVINASGQPIVQLTPTNEQWGPLTRNNPNNLQYAPVFFLPATTSNPSSNAPAFYNSYDPADNPGNTYTGSGTVMQRSVVFCMADQATMSGQTVQTQNPMTVTAANLPMSATETQAPIYINFAQGLPNSTSGPGSTGSTDYPFNQTDINNFFAVPHQWAVVAKIVTTIANGQTNVTPTILGLVKLNPYDFPLNFTTSIMQSAFGLTALPAPSSGTIPANFSQRTIFDGISSLYSMAFPKNKSADYSFAYLMLQGLMNGYLTSNTYSSIFSSQEWPQNTSYSPLYKKYFSSQIYLNPYLYLDQVFPTPATSDWLGTSSPLDWAYLRLMMASRLLVQSIYCPYDALILPASYLVNEHQKSVYQQPQGQSYATSVVEYMLTTPGAANENFTIVMPKGSQSSKQNLSSSRTIFGQNYILNNAKAQNPSQKDMWLLPVAASS